MHGPPHSNRKNIVFFEESLPGLAARHFFTDAVRCTQLNPPLYLAGLTCLICGMEGALRFSLNAKQGASLAYETDDLDGGPNFNIKLLRLASEQGFNVEVFAFPEEKGRMLEIIGNNEKPGLVEWRNEFAHGRAYRTAESIGDSTYSDSIMMGRAFRDMLNLSYNFATELARFLEVERSPSPPQNPLD
jgi:hypothetical protein